MSKQITITAYEFGELSNNAQEEVRRWYRESSDRDNYFSEYVIEEAVREGELMGIEFKTQARKSMSGRELTPDINIFWSGFGSQGDGACFEGTWRASDVKADKVADGWREDPATTEIKRIAAVFGRIAKLYPEASFSVRQSGHYNHENCTEFDFTIVEGDETQITDAEIEEAESALKKSAKDFMRLIYSQLESAWNDYNSDEQVDESIRLNEYLFSENGSRTITL